MTKKSVPLLKVIRHNFKIILGLFILFAALLCLFLYNPAVSIIYPPCPFYYLTGYYCPGCGSLRAVHQLLNGHILKALDLNPLMVLSLPFVIYLFLSQYKITVKGKVLFPRVIFPAVFYRVLLVVIMIYWVVRNIPVYPFSILAP